MKDIIKLKQDYLQTFNVVVEYFKNEDKLDFNEIEKNRDSLFTNTLNDILEYCKINRVYIQDFDDYKITYFMGVRLTKKTDNSEYLISTLKILDILVKKDSNNFIDENMIQKIILNIQANKWEDNYGKYGIYSIFKSCSKHLS